MDTLIELLTEAKFIFYHLYFKLVNARRISIKRYLPYKVVKNDVRYIPWILDNSLPSIQDRQLPIAYYTDHNQVAQFFDSCDDPAKCTWPKGFNFGADFQGVMEHELRHLMGVMWSEYYKQPFEGNGMVDFYNNSLFLMDLFILDADDVAVANGSPFVNPEGTPILHDGSDWAKAHRNMDSNEPAQRVTVTNLANLTPWINFGNKDHVFVYQDKKHRFNYVPLSNYTVFNPDGDWVPGKTNYRPGFNPVTNTATSFVFVLKDPFYLNQPATNKLVAQTQGGGIPGAVIADFEREFAVLSAVGWNIDPSGYKPPIKSGRAPTAKWYKTCFDSKGVFHASSKCVFSVLPEDLKRVDDDKSCHH